MTNIYHSQFKYKKAYDSHDIHGVQKARPWDLTEEIIKRMPKHGILVDVGCGPAKK